MQLIAFVIRCDTLVRSELSVPLSLKSLNVLRGVQHVLVSRETADVARNQHSFCFILSFQPVQKLSFWQNYNPVNN